MNIFHFLIIYISFFIKETISEIINNNNRIEGVLKYILSSLVYLPTKKDSISFDYEKYKIICNNFRIISPDIEDISIINSNNKKDKDFHLYSLENLKVTFVFDIIIVDNVDLLFNEYDNFLEINFPQINYKYNYKNDFLYFDSLNVSENFSYILNSDIGLETLEYYVYIKEKDKCICKIGTEEYSIEEFPNVYMVHYLKKLMEYYLTEIEKKDIILNYDIQRILEKTLININNTEEKNDTVELEYIKLNKINIPYEKIETIKNNDERTLIIHQIQFFGNFKLSDYYKEYELLFELNEEKNQTIELSNRNLDFKLDDIKIDINYENDSINKTEIIEFLRGFIINKYSTILIEAKNEYYKNYKF